MLRAIAILIVATAAALPGVTARADLRLLMLDQAGCIWCARWDTEVGSVYARTPEGRRAPLLRQRITGRLPEGVSIERPAHFTPTFVLLREGAEIGRIEGYPGEEFFYGMLDRLLDEGDEPATPREEKMKPSVIAAATAAAIATATPAFAEDEPAIVEFGMLRPSLAVELAQATLEHCRQQGYQVAVAVVDRSGIPQVILRDRFAGPHTIDTAKGKAWTAVSFRADTSQMDRDIKDGTLSQGLRDIPGALVLGGGVPISSAGSIVGGVGVSGAPGPDLDEACAKAGIGAISDRLDF